MANHDGDATWPGTKDLPKNKAVTDASNRELAENGLWADQYRGW
jgi:hypothetical protein